MKNVINNIFKDIIILQSDFYDLNIRLKKRQNELN